MSHMMLLCTHQGMSQVLSPRIAYASILLTSSQQDKHAAANHHHLVLISNRGQEEKKNLEANLEAGAVQVRAS
jgi:hypothetical protein